MSLWRRALFMTGVTSAMEEGGEEVDALAKDPAKLTEWINTKVLYQGGTDYESRPMLIFSACHLPDPQKVDYDLIYEAVLQRLDDFVESDYTMVFFSGGAKYRPGWAWLFKAYQQMSRKYKKNLKYLYIVHPSMWARVMIDMMGTVVSTKFAKKLVYIPTLSDLAVHVPLQPIRIPDEVYEYNFNFEPAVRVAPSARPRKPLVFGRELKEIMKEGELPQVLRDCIAFIHAEILEVEGIFRRSPPSSSLKAARDMYDRGEAVNLRGMDEHVAPVLLKMFLRELPTPLFHPGLYGGLRGVEVGGIRAALEGGMGREGWRVLEAITGLLHAVAGRSEHNCMTARNLTIVFAPNLTRGPDPLADIQECQPGGGVGRVFMLCIEHHAEIFRLGPEPVADPPTGVVAPQEDGPGRRVRSATAGSRLGLRVSIIGAEEREGERRDREMRRVPSTPGLKGILIPGHGRGRSVSGELEARSLPIEAGELRHSLPPLLLGVMSGGPGKTGQKGPSNRRRTMTFAI